MDGTKLRVDLSLRDLSLISMAVRLWDTQDIKNRMKNMFLISRQRQVSEYSEEELCEISKLVVQNANSINLPPSLSALLKRTILLIGQKIYHWNVYVFEIGLDIISTEKIYFSFGAVDEIMIFDLYWKDLMTPDSFRYDSYTFKHCPLFSIACMYGCERFVKERKNDMLDELIKFWPEIKAGDEIYNIMSVSICLTRLDVLRDKIEIENIPSAQRMFEICLEHGFSKAARFYWEKLDEVDKVSNLTNFAKKCFLKYSEGFVKEKHCGDLLFLINKMGEEERYLFVAEYADELIKMFLPIWPYQEVVVDFLKYDWDIDSSRLQELAWFLIWFSNEMNSLEFPLDNELVFQIMQKAWGYISVDDKLHFLGDYQEIISSFFLTLNPKILNLLFNDPSFTELNRENMYWLIKKGFLELVEAGKFDFLNEIIKTVFNFIPDPKEFLKENFSNYSFLGDLIYSDESIGFLDQFLDFSAKSEAERTRLKNNINTMSVVRSLMEPLPRMVNIEPANNFLKWKLGTDAEVKRFKEEMKSYNFVIVEYSKYVRIKSGDLSWLRPGDELAMHPDEDPFDNAEGLTFLKIEDATELSRGVVLGIKSFCSGMDYNFLGPNWCDAKRKPVDYVGTEVGDFIVFTVRKIWSSSISQYYFLESAVALSNAFIKFYYETDEEVVKFKKTKLQLLVTENLTEFLLGVCDGRSHLETDVSGNFLDDFCEFCMIASEKIEEFKIQQRSDIDKVLDTHLVNGLGFYFCDYYLNFVLGKFKKTEVSKKFLNSSNKSALMCVSLLKKWGQVSPFYSPDVDVLKWLKLVDDKEKLKNDVFALYGNTPEWFPSFLD